VGAPETGTSPLLEDLCLRSLFSPFSRFSFLFFFSFLCFLCEEEFDEEEEAGTVDCGMTTAACVEDVGKGMLTTIDLVGCRGCWWPCSVLTSFLISILGSLIEDRPSRNFSKPVISSTPANPKFGPISRPDVVLCLLEEDVCVMGVAVVVVVSSVSGSKISPMSSFSTLGCDKVEEVTGGGGGCCARCVG